MDASLVAWLAQSYATVRPLMAIIGWVIALALAVIIVYVNYRAYRRIKELEDT